MAKRAALLVNLGSPDSYEVPDVKKYLREFLMDKRVIDYPWLFRFLLIEGIILNTRPAKSAEAYKSIWWDEGSPLIVLSRKLHTEVQKYAEVPVALGMRYGNPSIEDGLRELARNNPDLEEVKLVPLYPHYAMSSFETVVVKAEEVIQRHFKGLRLFVQEPFYQHPDYISALGKTLSPHLQKDYDHILFSYHGIPERHIRKSDITGSHCLSMDNCCAVDSPAHAFCYRHQVLTTTQRLVEELNLPTGKYSNSFQSRLDDKWLRPFTDKELAAFPARGIKKLIVLCPAFVSDCLETIEEIGEEGREIFMEAGGEEFTLVPCLNDQEDWCRLVAQWAEE